MSLKGVTRPKYANRFQADNLTFAGAEHLANTIRAFWYRQGKFPNVLIVNDRPKNLAGSEGTGGVYGVRSDMKNGAAQ